MANTLSAYDRQRRRVSARAKMQERINQGEAKAIAMEKKRLGKFVAVCHCGEWGANLDLLAWDQAHRVAKLAHPFVCPNNVVLCSGQWCKGHRKTGGPTYVPHLGTEDRGQTN